MTTLISRASSRFRDPSNNVVSTAQWCQYINQAYKDVNTSSNLWPWLESAEQTIAFGAGDRGAALPADVLQVNWVYDVTHDRRLFDDMGRGAFWHKDQLRSDTGLPTVYRLRGSCIELYPLPDETISLRAEVVAWPAALTDSDEPVWPETFHELLLEGALMRAYADDGQSEWYTLHKAAFEEGTLRMQRALLSIRTETNTPIRDTMWM
jgi:hypothetical protein